MRHITLYHNTTVVRYIHTDSSELKTVFCSAIQRASMRALADVLSNLVLVSKFATLCSALSRAESHSHIKPSTYTHEIHHKYAGCLKGFHLRYRDPAVAATGHRYTVLQEIPPLLKLLTGRVHLFQVRELHTKYIREGMDGFPCTR